MLGLRTFVHSPPIGGPLAPDAKNVQFDAHMTPPRCSPLAVCLFGLAPLLVMGCSDSTSPGGPVAGHWTGSPAGYAPMDFNLKQTDTLISGSGQLGGTRPQPMAAIGFYSTNPTFANRVALTFSAENTIPAIFLGNLSANGDTLRGTFTIMDHIPVDTLAFIRSQ